MKTKHKLFLLYTILSTFLFFSACTINSLSESSSTSTYSENVCIDTNLKAMVCGFSVNAKKISTSDTPIDILKNKQITELTSSSTIRQQNLLGSFCSFETLDQRLQYKMSRSNAFINTFRLGVDNEFSNYEKIKYLLPISDSQCNINPKIKSNDIRKDRYMNYYCYRGICRVNTCFTILGIEMCFSVPSQAYDPETIMEKLKTGENFNYRFLKDGNYVLMQEEWIYLDWDSKLQTGWSLYIDKPNKYFYRRTLPLVWNSYNKNTTSKFECRNSNECYSAVCSKDFYSRGVCKDKNTNANIPCDCTIKMFMIGNTFYNGIFCRVTYDGSEIYIQLHKDESTNTYYINTDDVFDFSLVESKIYRYTPSKFNNFYVMNILKNSYLIKNCNIDPNDLKNETPLEVKDGKKVSSTHNVKIKINSLGKCKVTNSNDLELETYGWCEPCTTLTMTSQFTKELGRTDICPTFHWMKDPVLNIEFEIAQTGKRSRHGGGMFDSTRRYCDIWFSDDYIGFGYREGINCGKWPGEKWTNHYPHPGFASYYLTKYLSQNVFPIIDVDPSLPFTDARCRDSTYMVVGSHESGKRGPVMINLRGFNSPEEALKRLFPLRYARWYDKTKSDGKGGDINHRDYIYLKGCYPTCYMGLQVNSTALGIYGINNPQDYEKKVMEYLENMLGKDDLTRNVDQKFLYKEIDFIAIDFPAHRYYLWYKDMSFERAFNSMLQFHANLSRKIYDKWQKFVIIKPLWGVTRITNEISYKTVVILDNHREVYSPYYKERQHPNWVSCRDILRHGLGIFPFKVLKRENDNQRVVAYMKGERKTVRGVTYGPDRDEYLPISIPTSLHSFPNWNGINDDCGPDENVHDWPYITDKVNPQLFVVDYLNGIIVDLTEASDYAYQYVNGHLGIGPLNSRRKEFGMNITIEQYLCENGLLVILDDLNHYWNEKLHSMFLRYVLENQRMLTDSVTIGMLLTPENSVANPITDQNGDPLIPLFWKVRKGVCSFSLLELDKESLVMSEAAKIIQKYGRLVTGQKDMVLYTRHYAMDNCEYQSFGDPSSIVGYNEPDPNCVLTNYTDISSIPYCRKCSDTEMANGECGLKYQVSQDGVYCKVPDNENINEYRLDENNIPTIPDDLKKLYPLKDPNSFVRCGLCKYNTSYGSCEIKNSFTGYKLAEFPFSPSLLKEWDMDIVSSMKDKDGNQIYCCLIDYKFNPLSSRMINNYGLETSANRTNYYTFKRQVFQANAPETIIFSKNGTDFVNVFVGKKEYNINMFNFVRIDDERILDCQLNRKVNLNICYDQETYSNHIHNTISHLMNSILNEVPVDQRNYILVNYQSLQRKDLSKLKEKNCSIFVASNKIEFEKKHIINILEYLNEGRGLLLIVDNNNNNLLKELEIKVSSNQISYNAIDLNLSSITIDDNYYPYEFSDGEQFSIYSGFKDLNLSSTHKSSAIVFYGVSNEANNRIKLNGKIGIGIYRYGRFSAITSDLFKVHSVNQMNEIQKNMLRYVLRFGR